MMLKQKPWICAAALAAGAVLIFFVEWLGVPVKLAGVGESLEDLRPFDAREYVEAII